MIYSTMYNYFILIKQNQHHGMLVWKESLCRYKQEIKFKVNNVLSSFFAFRSSWIIVFVTIASCNMASAIFNVYKTLLQYTIPGVITVSTVLGSMTALHAAEGEASITNILKLFVYIHIYFMYSLWFATLLLKLIKIGKIQDATVCNNVCYMADFISDLPRPLFWLVLITSLFCAKLSNVFMPMVMLQISAFFAQASFAQAACCRTNEIRSMEEINWQQKHGKCYTIKYYACFFHH